MQATVSGIADDQYLGNAATELRVYLNTQIHASVIIAVLD
jgi:hypothetical protein